MDIKLITDGIFNLEQILIPAIINEQEKKPKKDGERFDPKKQKTEEAEDNKIISSVLKPILLKELTTIFPNADLWIKGDGLPERKSEFVWVVSPYVQRLMGLTYTSIALQKNDELLIGVFFNWRDQKIVTGEKGLGANVFDESLKVSDQAIHPESSYIYYLPDMSGGKEEKEKFMLFFSMYKQIFDKIQKMASDTRPAYNAVMENVAGSIIRVAGGTLDLTWAANFDYTDVAAAIAVVEEAGGICTDFRGGKEKLYTGEELFCSNKAIHATFLEIAKEHLKD
ncbi:MAG: inositol monophosphatase family protein [Bacteroidota bacterium]|nr:inositol monophosphatase family protein [Bacteroidota bacterium]